MKPVNIHDHILLITTVSLDTWQHHSWFYNGRGWYVIEMMSSDSYWFQKVRWRLTVIKRLLTAHAEVTVSMNMVQWWVRWIKEAETRWAVFHEKHTSGCTWEYLAQRGMISNHYTETTRSLNACLCQVCPIWKMSQVFPLRTTLGHTRVCTLQRQSTHFGCRV